LIGSTADEGKECGHEKKFACHDSTTTQVKCYDMDTHKGHVSIAQRRGRVGVGRERKAGEGDGRRTDQRGELTIRKRRADPDVKMRKGTRLIAKGRRKADEQRR